ncbi:MAG TPA: prefoldin subunit alpha [Euryarchaeota archaeon]|nr:prefoldin subunit alpha [archaeon BMS3Abin16]GBE56713.1 prefoldin subunit alpha [archaeon BMS3Bbin16]HDH27790.1 prefoldin subunit alpha [Euryarchaeota archaeon]HDY74560.1 prefoldin subunit alpha [Euryarchaeota archaeon]
MTEDGMNAEQMMMEYEQIRGQIEALQEGLNMIDSSIMQMDSALEALTAVSSLTGDNEILLPVGADSFLSAKITDTENALVGIGAEVAVKKKISDAVSDAKSKKDVLVKTREQRGRELERLVGFAQEMAPKLQAMMAKTQSGG